MCFSYFVTSGLLESNAVSVDQISKKFELKNAWATPEQS